MIESDSFHTDDGIEIAWREMGQGRPLLLIHGFMSDADTNWIKYGHAGVLADVGYRVIMPDLRVHGSSDAPHEEEFYPADVLVRDLEDMVAHLGLTDYDLGGFSLGARPSVRGVIGRTACWGRASAPRPAA